MNPGHYVLLKSIQAGFHQGHPIFSATREIQSSCMSFHRICSPDFKSESRWNEANLGAVLEKDHNFYRL